MKPIFSFIISFLCLSSTCVALQIQGSIQVSSSFQGPLEGLNVVLLKFQPDASGKIQTSGPIARTLTQADGSFLFEDVPSDMNAAYQVGSRVNGRLVQSDYAFIKQGQTQVSLNIKVPGMSENTDALALERASLFLEPHIGRLIVTEFLIVNNPTSDIIHTQKQPFVWELPQEHTQFQMIQNPNEQIAHSFLGSQLQFRQYFAPGTTSLVFQYWIPVLWQSHVWTQSYPETMQKLVVLSPPGALDLDLPNAVSLGQQKLGDNTFDAWDIPKDEWSKFEVSISGVPISQKTYLWAIAGMLVLLFGGLGIFIQRRLKTEDVI